MQNEKLGVILLNMGGPDALGDVPQYLLNIFRDPCILDVPLGAIVRPLLSRIIVRKRAAASADRYAQIGGKSPLADITTQQAAAIQAILHQHGIAAVVLPGMRYWHPFAHDAVKRLADEKVDRIVALSMYPACCRATTGSSLDDFRRAVGKYAPDTPCIEIDAWPNLPQYVEFLAQHVTAALNAMDEREWPRTAVLFSAHSVPSKIVEQGDPYKNQIEKIFRLACAQLPRNTRTALGWQSAVGPAKWLAPDTKCVAGGLRHEGVRNLIVVPLGFVAENIETLWDIEIDLRSCARSLGFASFARIACPNDDAGVLNGLADLVVKALGDTDHGR